MSDASTTLGDIWFEILVFGTVFIVCLALIIETLGKILHRLEKNAKP